VLLLGAPGVAGAAVNPGDYGGGAIKAGSRAGHTSTGSSWMWARVGADGHARIGGRVNLGCGLAVFDGEVTPAADGSFAFTRSRRYRSRGHRLRAIVTVRGRFDGAAASGRILAGLRNRHPDGKVRRCATSRRGARWQLRQPAAPSAPAPAQARATYRGLTSQSGSEPRPFLLRVARAGDRIVTSVFEYTRACRKGEFFLNDVSPGARIRPDGTFTIREGFTLPYVRNDERFRIRIDGQFRAGAVAGTLRVTTVLRRRGSGRVTDRCDTGPLTFSAAL
jgi:hypothetical protein